MRILEIKFERNWNFENYLRDEREIIHKSKTKIKKVRGGTWPKGSHAEVVGAYCIQDLIMGTQKLDTAAKVLRINVCPRSNLSCNQL